MNVFESDSQYLVGDLLAKAMVGASTSTQYLGTSTRTLKMFKYKYKYRVLQNVLGYYPSTLQMYLGTITKYQVQMYIITHKNIPEMHKLRNKGHTELNSLFIHCLLEY